MLGNCDDTLMSLIFWDAAQHQNGNYAVSSEDLSLKLKIISSNAGVILVVSCEGVGISQTLCFYCLHQHIVWHSRRSTN